MGNLNRKEDVADKIVKYKLIRLVAAVPMLVVVLLVVVTPELQRKSLLEIIGLIIGTLFWGVVIYTIGSDVRGRNASSRSKDKADKA